MSTCEFEAELQLGALPSPAMSDNGKEEEEELPFSEQDPLLSAGECKNGDKDTTLPENQLLQDDALPVDNSPMDKSPSPIPFVSELDADTGTVKTARLERVKGTRFQSASGLSTRRKFLLGLVIVVLIAVTWVGSTQTAKSTYSGRFAAPFFIMWFGTVWMMAVFPLTVPLYFISGRGRLDKEGVKQLWRHCVQVFSPEGLTLHSLLTSTVLFAIIWAVTNYMYLRALMIIAATDVTALFSSAPAFVFLFSIFVLKEPPLVLRFGSVVMAVCGIVLFAYVDGFQSASIVGVLLSVGSAIGAATYKVLLKWRVGDASLYQMALFLSLVGLFSTLALWPLVLVLHFSGAEVLVEIPWGYLCASSVLGVAFNYSINFGIAYTFPLFISLGTILGIPLNALVDALVRGVDFLNWKFTATDLIVGGFLLMLVPPEDSVYIHNKVSRLASSCKPCS